MPCEGCGSESRPVAGSLGLCVDCLRAGKAGCTDVAVQVHRRLRSKFPLPVSVPRGEGRSCSRCANECVIPDGGRGYCGVRHAVEGKVSGGNARDGVAHWYADPLPTNCVADWVCPAGGRAGYPRYSHIEGPEFGFFNLAVFYYYMGTSRSVPCGHHFRVEIIIGKLLAGSRERTAWPAEVVKQLWRDTPRRGNVDLILPLVGDPGGAELDVGRCFSVDFEDGTGGTVRILAGIGGVDAQGNQVI